MTTAVYSIQGGDFAHGGSASRAVKEQLKKVGADPAVVRRAMIAAYEAEMNVVIHAHRGALHARLQNGQLDVDVIDEGPGILDIERAMRPGFSTASAQARELGFGAGMGLPNIQKNSDRFAIESAAGQGTKVSFTILLKPQTLYGAGQHSIHIEPELCHGCFVCVHECPTRAVRVYRGKPQLLDYLCVDCTACMASCPSGAIVMQGPPAELKPAAGTALFLTAPSIVQFGAGITPQRVIDALHALGFEEVRVTATWECALRDAVVEFARTEATARPVISPACPAVVNLIETRFPSLIPHLAPFLSPLEAVLAEPDSRRRTFVVSCPCQRTALMSGGATTAVEVSDPTALRMLLMPILHEKHVDLAPPTVAAPPRSRPPAADVVRVMGTRHVVNMLEQIENGLATDVAAVELFICDEAGFGSPLMFEDPFLARHRWEAAPPPADPAAKAVRRTKPYAARAGLRLDQDMARAIQKLSRIDKLTKSLPGHNCALCGAPSCAALAEDIVLGRAQPEACVRQPAPGANAPDQSPPEKTP